jgi:hypothetical protein
MDRIDTILDPVTSNRLRLSRYASCTIDIRREWEFARRPPNAVGLPHHQPATEKLASPLGGRESFGIRVERPAALLDFDSVYVRFGSNSTESA